MVRALTCGAEGPQIENHLQSGEQKTLSVHPAANGYLTLFRAEEGLGGEGRVDGHHPLHAVPSDTSGTIAFTAPTANWLWDLPLPLPFYRIKHLRAHL